MINCYGINRPSSSPLLHQQNKEIILWILFSSFSLRPLYETIWHTHTHTTHTHRHNKQQRIYEYRHNYWNWNSISIYITNNRIYYESKEIHGHKHIHTLILGEMRYSVGGTPTGFIASSHTHTNNTNITSDISLYVYIIVYTISQNYTNLGFGRKIGAESVCVCVCVIERKLECESGICMKNGPWASREWHAYICCVQFVARLQQTLSDTGRGWGWSSTVVSHDEIDDYIAFGME